jgi:ABC-type maltose transport system permease subunit
MMSVMMCLLVCAYAAARLRAKGLRALAALQLAQQLAALARAGCPAGGC